MRLFVVFLLLAALPQAFAQEGLFVSQHNITYTLGESDFLAEEVIVFENMGTSYGNLFKDNIYFTRGDAREVEVEAAEEDLRYSVEYSDSTVININPIFWRGEKRTITLRYNRSDMLFSKDTVHSIDGLALGRYTWIADRATVKFKAPRGFQFGHVMPPAAKTIEESKEVLTYDLTPAGIENLTIIREGLPVWFEYAKFSELAAVEIQTAGEFIEDAESDLKGANKSIENALEQVQDVTQILTLFEIASNRLNEAKSALELAEVKSNQYSAEYSPYEAYYYAKQSRNLSKEASRKAGEAKDLANYEIQKALEDKITGIGSKLQERSGAALAPVSDELQEAGSLFQIAGQWVAILGILAAFVMFEIYRRSGGYKRASASKKSTVGDFRAIDELKHKTFTGFDKKVDAVKHGTELAKEIRDLRREKEELERELEKLQRKAEREEISEQDFDTEREKIDTEINEISSKIGELKSRLDELKRSNK
jgi:predicted  nucleic acid-binding Zn-ribbon protein